MAHNSLFFSPTTGATLASKSPSLLRFHLSTCPLPQPQELWAASSSCVDSNSNTPLSPSVVLMDSGGGFLILSGTELGCKVCLWQ